MTYEETSTDIIVLDCIETSGENVFAVYVDSSTSWFKFSISNSETITLTKGFWSSTAPGTAFWVTFIDKLPDVNGVS